jgi:hypothetical protein
VLLGTPGLLRFCPGSAALDPAAFVVHPALAVIARPTPTGLWVAFVAAPGPAGRLPFSPVPAGPFASGPAALAAGLAALPPAAAAAAFAALAAGPQPTPPPPGRQLRLAL